MFTNSPVYAAAKDPGFFRKRYEVTAMIYLLRHGAIELPQADVMVGQIDLPLSAEGIKQAAWWKKSFAEDTFDRIYCSDLTRSLHTARIISQRRNENIEVLAGLREIDLGAWEGLSRRFIHERFPAEWKERQKDVIGHRPPGGESFVDLKERVIGIFEEIAMVATDTVLIVAHAGVNRIILASILGMPLQNIFRLKVDCGSVSIIDAVKEEMRVLAVNIPPFVAIKHQ